MSDETKRYNGWTNYRDVVCSLVADKRRRKLSILARGSGETSDIQHQLKEGIWTVQIAERAEFADQLKSEIEEASPIEEASLFSDLLNAAISKKLIGGR